MMTKVIRFATDDERKLIDAALIHDEQIDSVDEMPDHEVYIREGYTTDGPGFQGSVAIVHWGGSPGFISIYCRYQNKWVREKVNNY